MCIVGRAGRVAHGRVYRLVTYKFWHDLKEHTEPEMQVCLHLVLILQAIGCCGSEKFHIFDKVEWQHVQGVVVFLMPTVTRLMMKE